MRLQALLFFLFALSNTLISQDYLESVNCYSDNNYAEWDIYTNNLEGKLEITWKLQGDFTDWSFELGEMHGSIRQKWPNDDTQYELRTSEGYVVTMRTRWVNDHSEWRVVGEGPELIWRSRFFDDGNEWSVVGDEFGTFSMYTEFEDDPRDWLIEDYLMEDAFWPEKIGCIFLTLIRVVRLYQK